MSSTRPSRKSFLIDSVSNEENEDERAEQLDEFSENGNEASGEDESDLNGNEQSKIWSTNSRIFPITSKTWDYNPELSSASKNTCLTVHGCLAN
ncbi:hypothetical protein M3Y97_00327400 [Aphelenchoides bicaudatus]|nr:hypothetical protein M3Y97_00327400 [Aphelenchoides bicaudatus]